MSFQQGPTGPPPDVFGDFGRSANIPYRRIVKWGIAILAVILIFVLLNIAKNVYTDWLWFDALGLSDVYEKRIFTRLWLFFAGAGVFVAAFSINVLLAQRFAAREEPAVLPPETIVLIRGLTRVGIVVVAIMFAFIFGGVASGQWENFLRFTNSEAFIDVGGAAILDPQFNHNPSFYVFELPFLRFIQTWTMGVLLLLLVSAVAIYGVGYSLRGFQWSFPRSVKLHVGVVAALVAVTVAWSYWFDINELVLSSRGLSGTLLGANATDVVAKIFALRFMMGVAVLVGILAIASAFVKGFQLPLGAFGFWAISAIVLLAMYPSLYQRFSVQPSELDKETPYIERNIAMTREAFALNRIETKPFTLGRELEAEDLFSQTGLVDNIRLWDHRPLRDTYNQIQFLRPYYTFTDVDVDRYEIEGRIQQVMLSARELATENLPHEAQSWVAQRLQYTHGFGLAMSPVTKFTPQGQPEFFLKDVPPRGVPDFVIERAEIYYGERSQNYVIVGTDTEEFSYPTEQDTPVFTTYAGAGGVTLDSFIKKIAFAWRLADFNILISGEINSESRILFFRHIQDRAQRLAPFLAYDPDPYLAVGDGKLWWIQDAFTTTRRFPYSQRFRGGINYIRNSVKVVTDAYNGTVRFYVMDPDDAILRTYQRIFPDLFVPFSEMPEELKDNIRYPEQLLNVQEEMYRTYHVTDSRVFFTKEDVRSRPLETFYDASQPMEAYYVNMPLPGEDDEEFLLLIPFTPLNKPNLVSWLAARNDAPNYGQVVEYTFPKDQQVDGPQQVEARISNDPRISQQFTLWGQQGSQIIRGNLIVIPLDETLIYIEPIYLQAETLNFPELKRVIVVIGNKSPVMEPTLEQALQVSFGLAVPTPIGAATGFTPGPSVPVPAETPTPQAPSDTPTRSADQAELDEIIDNLERLLEQLRQLQQEQN